MTPLIDYLLTGVDLLLGRVDYAVPVVHGEVEYMGSRSGYTTEILDRALNSLEVVKEWPYCIVVWDRKNAERMMCILVEMAAGRHVHVTGKGRVSIDGAVYNFIVKSSIIQWNHGYEYFTDIVEDNQVFEAELSRSRTGKVRRRQYESDLWLERIKW